MRKVTFMDRISSLTELRTHRQRIQNGTLESKPCLVICAGTGGQASGSNDTIRAIKNHILKNGLSERISLRITGCQGFCEMDPFILVEPDNNLYPRLTMEDVPRVIDSAIAGEVAQELLYRSPGEESKHYECQDDIPFFKNQTRTILGQNAGLDPIRLYDYMKRGGYCALEKALEHNDPAGIVKEITDSGLRGRGGGGFLTGTKWRLARQAGKPNVQKYFVCNADEGDPGAYMDRSLLEGNPHSIIEGMLIGGLAMGASKGIVYVRTEYPLAIKHTLIALRQARELGLLGKDILGTGFDFDIEIVRGAGAFVCGEETALIRSIEGKIGEPRQRPPYPIEKGLWGCPTCINNVETIANIPVIINTGAEKYAKVGVPGNSGTKIFSLVGKIQNTGLVEVPMGTSIKKIVYDIGGGSNSHAKVKAVQTGGPSGGCIPAHMFDMLIDYDTLAKAGSIMGSGGMIVMDENSCMVDVAKYFMNFLKGESCGKCYTCRKGTQRMYEILDDISTGKATTDDLALLEELAHVVKDTTMCGLGQTASNPLLSTLRYYREEYLAHIERKECPAGVCKDLVGAPCQDACPVNTEAWRYVAHVAREEYKEAYQVIRKANPFPSACSRVCNHPCESRCKSATAGGDAVAIRALKRFVTDNVDPAIFQTKVEPAGKDAPRVAVVGAGPSGLSAAHYLSLLGCRVTVFEAESKAGGMLVSGIPAYRLPRDVLQREIDALLNDNITIEFKKALGRDMTTTQLRKDGFRAVYVAIGAHRSRNLAISGEDAKGVHKSMAFLKAHNLNGKELALGKVGVVGGGNAAVDAARVAIRQKAVKDVTIFYRRTRAEMPAYAEEIEAALEEGIRIVPLVSPISITSKNKGMQSVRFLRNELGDWDASGRRRPVPLEGSEFDQDLDTLIVAIGEQPDPEALSGLDVTAWGTLAVDGCATAEEGVFAGGDVARGPNTVIEAIADGKAAARAIWRYIRSEVGPEAPRVRLPEFYIPPLEKAPEAAARFTQATLPVNKRKLNFNEVDRCMTAEEARREAERCLRCDLEFTQSKEPESVLSAEGGGQ